MFRTIRKPRSKSSNLLSSVDVELIEDRSYRPGETVHGKVTLALSEPTAVKEIYVVLMGVADNATHRSVGISGPVFFNSRTTILSDKQLTAQNTPSDSEQVATTNAEHNIGLNVATTNINNNSTVTQYDVVGCAPQPISRHASQTSNKSIEEDNQHSIFIIDNNNNNDTAMSTESSLEMTMSHFDANNNNSSKTPTTTEQPHDLGIGKHTWPFTILLPIDSHLPNSLESQRNQVYYLVRTFVVRARSSTLMAEADVRIRDPITIDREPYSLPLVLRCPFHVNVAASWLARSAAGDAIASFAPLKALVRNSPKSLFDRLRSQSARSTIQLPAASLSSTSLASSSSASSPHSDDQQSNNATIANSDDRLTDLSTPQNDGVYASLSLARTGYKAGERIRMMVGLSGIEMAGPIGVKARLRRICVHRSNNLVDVENIVIAGGQRPLGESSGVFELQLPRRMLSTSNAPGNQLNCMDGPGCVTVRYTLEVSLRYCVGPALLPRPVAKFRVPVVIGVFAPAASSSQEAAAAMARQRRWAAWWRMLALGDDPASAQMYSHALSLGIGNSDGPSLADWELADELNASSAPSSTGPSGLLPVYEPPPPNYYEDVPRIEQRSTSIVAGGASMTSILSETESTDELLMPRYSLPPTYDIATRAAIITTALEH